MIEEQLSRILRTVQQLQAFAQGEKGVHIDVRTAYSKDYAAVDFNIFLMGEDYGVINSYSYKFASYKTLEQNELELQKAIQKIRDLGIDL